MNEKVEDTLVSKAEPLQEDKAILPLLYQKREYLTESSYSSGTTDCEKTTNPKDYGPDD